MVFKIDHICVRYISLSLNLAECLTANLPVNRGYSAYLANKVDISLSLSLSYIISSLLMPTDLNTTLMAECSVDVFDINHSIH